MSGPWEKYSSGPWERYQAQPAAEPNRGRLNLPIPQAIKDLSRKAVTGATFGLADRAAAGIKGTTVEEERAETDAATERTGWAGVAAEVGGSLLPIGGVAKLGLSPVARLANSGWKARTAAGVGEGAAYGAAMAAGHGDDISTGAAVGAAGGALAVPVASALSGAGKALGKGFRRVTGQMPKVPSGEELRTASQAAYAASEQAGVMLHRSGLERMRQEIVGDLTDLGYLPKNQPRTAAVLREIDKIAKGHATLKGLDQVRKAAGNSFSLERSDNKALEKIIKRIDRHIANMGGADVIMGDAAKGGEALRQARALWGRQAKADAVEKAIEKGRLMASTNASGGNTENEVRKQIRQLVTNPKKTRGWTPDELAQAKTAARGTPANNLLRQVGRFSPQGNGVGGMFGVGGIAAADPTMIGATVAGTVAKPVSTHLSGRSAERLAAMMRAGGTEELLSGPPSALERLSKAKREALVRALLAGELSLAPHAVGQGAN